MWLPFILFFVTVLGCFAAILVGMSVSDSMQMGDYLRLMAIFSPLIMVGVLGGRKYWIAIALGLMPLGYTLPMAFVGQFQIGVLFCVMVFAFVLGGFCFRQFSKVVVRDAGTAFIFLAGLIVLGRLLWDRPGSALLGGEGGGAQALLFLISFFCLWAFSKVASEEDWKPMMVMRITFILLLLAFFQRIIGRGLDSSDTELGAASGILGNLYSRPGWMLGGIVFAFIIYKFGKGKGPMLLNQNLIIATTGFIAVSAFSGHRSRPLFAMGTILLVAYIYRVHRRVFLILAMTVVIGLIGIASTGRDVLPPVVKRTLSIVFPISQQEAMRMNAEFGVGGEVGWESEFRSGLYAIAWEKIKGNPVFGAGFTFSTRDIMKLVAGFDQKISVIQLRLAMVGGYHNSLLQLAVGAGLPAAFFFALGTILILKKSLTQALSVAEPKAHFFLASMLGFVPPLLGQMLMNGDAKDFFRFCVVLGLLNGIGINRRFRRDTDPEWIVEKKDSTPKLSEGDIPAGFGGPLKW